MIFSSEELEKGSDEGEPTNGLSEETKKSLEECLLKNFDELM